MVVRKASMVATLAAFAAFAVWVPYTLCEGFLPKNSMKIPVGDKSATGLTEEQFNAVLDKIDEVYRPIIAKRGGKLVINRKWTAMRTRTNNSHQFHGPDMFGNGISYGRYLYSTRHSYGESFKLWSREAVVDDNYTTVCTWQFLESQKEKYMTFGTLKWEEGDLVLDALYVD